MISLRSDTGIYLEDNSDIEVRVFLNLCSKSYFEALSRIYRGYRF